MGTRLGFRVFAILLVSALCGTAAAAPEAEEGLTLLGRLEAEADHIMNQYKNALWRLEMDFKGMATKRGHATDKSTPFRECCGPNIEKIEASVKSLEKILTDLAECYETRGNAGGKADVAIVRTDLAKFAKIIGEMEKTDSRDEAKTKGVQGTRAFIDFTESSETLDDCPQP